MLSFSYIRKYMSGKYRERSNWEKAPEIYPYLKYNIFVQNLLAALAMVHIT